MKLRHLETEGKKVSSKLNSDKIFLVLSKLQKNTDCRRRERMKEIKIGCREKRNFISLFKKLVPSN